MIRHAFVFVALAASTLLAGCQQGEAGPAVVEVADLVCRETPRGQSQTACYATLTASQPDRLVSVSSPSAASVELHSMSTEGGIMRMSEMAEGLALPAGQGAQLAPGGDHIMVMGLAAPLEGGQSLPLTLTFERAAAVTLEAPVGVPGQAGAPGRRGRPGSPGVGADAPDEHAGH
ncbi:copper chaperone PCu(A)C [Brevundimonas lutea]|uniref:copper chaperone PCu(A)C n=1 Tax=Brevundimonas lutea TaxID=2293980 RepID=UPI000F02B786|nr:copper chaperone PCu(A)C [Brevundimonas lutea]